MPTASPRRTSPRPRPSWPRSDALLSQADTRDGGFGRAPKFPQTMSIDLLLRHARRSGDPAARSVALLALDAMASGGIYDHLGGGFARYSTDGRWLVPHFEKMLYDQALLARRVPARLAAHGRGPLPAGARRDDRLRAARPAPSRSAASSPPRTPTPRASRVRFYVWTLDEVRRSPGTTPTPPIDWYGVTARRQLGGREHPRAAGTGRPAAPAGRRAGPGRPVRGARERRVRPGLDDQGAHRVERADAGHPRRGGRRHRRPRTGWRRPSPPASSSWPSCGGPDGRWLRTWQGPADGSATRSGQAARLRRRPRRPARCLHPAPRGHGRAALAGRGPVGGRRAARPLLGRRGRRGVHHRVRRRGAGHPTRRTSWTTPPRRPTAWPRWGWCAWAPSPATTTSAERRRGDRPPPRRAGREGAAGVRPPPLRRRAAVAGRGRDRRHRRAARPASRSSSGGGRRLAVLPGGSPTTRRSGRAATSRVPTAGPTCAATTSARRRSAPLRTWPTSSPPCADPPRAASPTAAVDDLVQGAPRPVRRRAGAVVGGGVAEGDGADGPPRRRGCRAPPSPPRCARTARRTAPPDPTSRAASRATMAEKAVSTYQYGTAQRSSPSPSPVRALSGSA